MAIAGLWGNKIGMSQIFEGDKAIIVTAVDTSSWLIVGFKTMARDGYNAVKLGKLSPKYQGQAFDSAWLKNLSRYFSYVREVHCGELPSEFVVGADISALTSLPAGTNVDVVGTTKGRGFAGVVKRHGFNGGRSSHGGKNMLRRPGALSFMRSEGRVVKGKRMGGHLGDTRCTLKGLRVVRVDAAAQLMLISGSMPGKTGSLVFMRKCE